MNQEDATKAYDSLVEFAIPFAQALRKLKDASDRGITVTLSATESKAIIEALQLLKRGPERQL